MTTAEIDREQWRGKVRVSERRNSLGEVQYLAEVKLNWFSEWHAVHSREPELWHGHKVHPVDFPTLDAARDAAQLKWNEATAAHNADLKARFGSWRKVWP